MVTSKESSACQNFVIRPMPGLFVAFVLTSSVVSIIRAKVNVKVTKCKVGSYLKYQNHVLGRIDDATNSMNQS